jgi:hypothetical protein
MDNGTFDTADAAPTAGFGKAMFRCDSGGWNFVVRTKKVNIRKMTSIIAIIRSPIGGPPRRLKPVITRPANPFCKI